MKVVFLSNFYNHHQSFVSRKLYELTEGNYRFIATSPIPEERKKLGYRDVSEIFVLQYEECADEACQWINTADIVIAGSAPEHLLAERIAKKKIIFRYSEHPLKNGNQLWKYPLRWYSWHRRNPRFASIYMLCASAYTAEEYGKFGLFRNKAYKWGYFPECKKYGDIDKLISYKKKNEILWCGRFLDWKHPDDVLAVAKRLKNDCLDFHISIIGTGEMEEDLKSFCDKNDLSDVVSFYGSMSPDKVREHMERAGIYLMTSDHKEGWGAVLNEAMNSGCAVVASSVAGSTPYLIDNGENGIIYKFGNIDELYEKVRLLLEDFHIQTKMGKGAYATIAEKWNAEIAASHLIDLFDKILNGDDQPDIFKDGPCSKA